MRKFFSKSFLAGFGGGVLGYILFASLSPDIIGLSALYSKSFDADSHVPPLYSPSPDIVPAVSWEKIAEKTSLNSVAIQVFKDNNLVREGSGIIVSSDGLIATVADLALSGAVYQIFYENQILKASVVALDYKSNILLLKTSYTYGGVVDFDFEHTYQSGQDVLMAGKIITSSRPVLTTQKGTINYVTDKTVSIDANFNSYLSGFGIVNSYGKVIGLAYLRSGRINIVRPDLVDNFLETYINKL